MFNNNFSTEEWKDIQGYENLYQVSSFGRVKSIIYNKIILPIDNGCGYFMVSLSKNLKTNYYFVHRLVAQTFIPNYFNLSVINHKDENKKNNCVDNLEWCTASENTKYSHCIPIIQLDKNKNIINIFESCTQASKILGGNPQYYAKVIRDNKTYKNSKWKYLHDYLFDANEDISDLFDDIDFNTKKRIAYQCFKIV